jgi:hypothetical protein
MKKQEHTPVDDYIRQREADIPVIFDPEDWNRLAAALDAAAAAKPERVSPPPAPKTKTFRGVKGWWVSGVWLLALLTSTWMLWQGIGDARPASDPRLGEDTHTHLPEAATPTNEAGNLLGTPPVSGAAEKTGADRASQQPDTEAYPPNAHNDALLPAGTSDNPVPQAGMDAKKETGMGADSAHIRRMLPVDSTVTEKKKKHLFW